MVIPLESESKRPIVLGGGASLDVTSYDGLDPRQILESGLRIKRTEAISIRAVIQEGALVDEDHVESLKNSMLGDRGQISPLTVRARFDDERHIVYDVIDGFHRGAALLRIAEQTGQDRNASCVVIYGCADEEMYDLRVLAANSVRSVKFARMAQWMQSSFRHAAWSHARLGQLIAEGKLSIAQVFGLAYMDTDGSRMGIFPDEALELKSWARAKADQWNRPIVTLAIELRTVEAADPELVQKVRTGGGGTGGRGVLTHARLKAIVDELPGAWDLQRDVVNLVLENNFVAEQAGQLAYAIAEAKRRGEDGRIQTILKDPNFYVSRKGAAKGTAPVDFESSTSARSPYESPKPQTGERQSHPLRSKDDRLPESKDLLGRIRELEVIVRYQAQEIKKLTARLTRGDSESGIIYAKPITLESRDWGDVTFDPNSGQVGSKQSGFVELTQREVEIFQMFFDSPGMVFSATMIGTLLHGADYAGYSKDLIRVHIKNIRVKLARVSLTLSQKLTTQGRFGYKWVE